MRSGRALAGKTADIDFALSPMVTDDIPDVLEIESVSFSNPWRKQDFEYSLREENGICRVSRLDGLVVGYAVGFFTKHELHLADFAVRPECQRRGYGRALLKIFLGQLEQMGTKIATLEVRQSNQRAVGLYSRAGFQTVAIRNDYYSRPKESAIVMIKSLDGDLSNWVPTPSTMTLKWTKVVDLTRV